MHQFLPMLHVMIGCNISGFSLLKISEIVGVILESSTGIVMAEGRVKFIEEVGRGTSPRWGFIRGGGASIPSPKC